MTSNQLTGYPSIDKPWMKYYTEEAINAPLPECTTYEYLVETSRDIHDHIAINYYGAKVTYAQLLSKIQETAAAFKGIGIEKGDVVMIASVTVPEVIYSFYALNYLGAISNMLDPRTNTEVMKMHLERTNTKCIVAIEQALPRVAKLQELGFTGKVVALSPRDSLPTVKKALYSMKNKRNTEGEHMIWSQFMACGKGIAVEKASYKKDNPAVILYTSGTTGIPKGTVLSDDTLNIVALQFQYLGADVEEKTYLDIMPPFVSYGVVCGMHMPLIMGAEVILVPMLDADKLGDLIAKHKPSHFLGAPIHCQKMINSPKLKNADLSFLRNAGAGGDKFLLETEKQINQFLRSHNSKYDVAKGYGMAEVGSSAAACFGNINKLGSAGIPHVKTVISVFDVETGEELTYGQKGEICFCTPAMMLGYMNNEKETKEILKEHADGTVWVHSGDLGYMDEDGFIFLDGRLKRMIIRPDGHNVFPIAIENVIIDHPAVENCVVVGKRDAEIKTGRWPTAFMVLKDEWKGKTAVLDEIRALCDEKIPVRDTAVYFYEIDEIPLTIIGKVDYPALEKLADEK